MAKVDKTGPKEFICPGCGAVMKNTAFSPITETCGAKLVDGWLCKDCASRLRIKYPMYYEKDKKYFYEKKGDSYVRVKSEDGGGLFSPQSKTSSSTQMSTASSTTAPPATPSI